MARVNLEERAFADAGLLRVAREMAGKWEADERQALGALGHVWRDSQELLKTTGTRQQIEDWARCKTKEEADALIPALVAAGYLTEKPNGTFLIHGNQEQIESRVKHLEKSKKGGRATHKKWRAEKTQSDQIDNPGPEADLQPSENRAAGTPNSRQGKARQGRAKQLKAEQPNSNHEEVAPGVAPSAPAVTPDDGGWGEFMDDDTPGQPALIPEVLPPEEPARPRKAGKGRQPKVAKTEAPSTPLWLAYAEEYAARWGAPPVRNAKMNRNLCDLIARIGAEDAPSVLRHYVRSNHRRYVDARHGIGLALMDAEKLHNEWVTGTSSTESLARTLDRTQATFDAADRAFEYVNGRRSQHEGL